MCGGGPDLRRPPGAVGVRPRAERWALARRLERHHVCHLNSGRTAWRRRRLVGSWLSCDRRVKSCQERFGER